MARLPRGTLPKDRTERVVPLLFPQTDWKVTDEEIQFFASHQPYAFPYDRQSNEKELKRKDATGAYRRVEAIMEIAKKAGLYLPEPVPIPYEEREEGDLPYAYDDRFWHVDGETQRATGYSASQFARPKLWEAFLKGQALARHGVGPSHFIVGEASRFFRDQKWATDFAVALWRHKITLVVHPFGVVNETNLGGLTAYINAISGWLPMVMKGAKEARRAQRRPFSKRVPFCLRVSGETGEEPEETRTHIWTHPDRWNPFADSIRLLAAGELPTTYDAAAWLNENHGIRLSKARFLQLLYSRIPEGIHVLYDEKCTPRRVVQEGGLWSDLDIRENGTRRYKVDDVPGVPFDIQFTEGTTPIAIEDVILARGRVRGNVGRPVTTSDQGKKKRSYMRRMEEVYLPTRLIKCACCGSSVRQFAPFGKSGTKWYLHCGIVQNARVREKWSTARAREWVTEYEPHKQGASVNLQDLVWNLIVERLAVLPPPMVNPDVETGRRMEVARRQLTAAEQAFKDYQRRVADGEMGDQRDPLVKESIEENRLRLHADVLRTRKDVSQLDSDPLTAHKEQVAREMLAKIITLVGQHNKGGVEARREVLELVVEKVVVHLEEGWFDVHASVDWPSLRQLRGQWTPDSSPEKETNPSITFHFRETWRGRWAA